MRINNDYKRTSFKREPSCVIKIFIGVWLLVMGFFFVLPINFAGKNKFESVLINFFFVYIVSTIAYLWSSSRLSRIVLKRRYPTKKLKRKKLFFILDFSVIAAVIGLALVMWDRVHVRGINYSLGLRSARYQWLNAGNIGSIWGKLGNILIPFCYCGLLLGLFHWEKLCKRRRVVSVVVGIGAQVLFALINGGRSNILMVLCFAFSVLIMRKCSGKAFIPHIRNLKLYVVLACLGIFFYSAYIFYSFSESNIYYIDMVVQMLGCELNAYYFKHSNFIINTIILMFMYMFHGVAYTGPVVQSCPPLIGVQDIDNNITLRGISVILDRLGIVSFNMKLPEFDGGGGNFIALPGSLLYDYGYIGYVMCSVLFGILLGKAISILKKDNCTIFEIVFCITMLIHMVLSPVVMALGLGYFTFMIMALVLMEIIAGSLYGFTGWTEIEENEV